MLENDPINMDDQGSSPAAAVAMPPNALVLRVRSIDGVTAAVALLVALAGGGLYAMNVRTNAGMERIAAVGASSTDVDTLLSGGRESIAALSRSVHATRDLVTRLTTRNKVGDDDNVQLASAVRSPDGSVGPRDPFIFKAAEMTPADTTPATPAAPAGPDREQLRTEALAAARQLQVQSIIHGSARRSALINGKLYFEGQAIDERFTLQSISGDAVVVRNGEFRFELRLRN